MYNSIPKYPSISANLIKTLEENPDKYYEDLCALKNEYSSDIIKNIVDCVDYNCYMGNHLHAIIYVVGDLVNKDIPNGIYGAKIAVHEDVGILILDKLVEYNIDLYNENYYDELPLKNLMSNGHTKRKNNTKFKKILQDHYIRDLNKTLPLYS